MTDACFTMRRDDLRIYFVGTCLPFCDLLVLGELLAEIVELPDRASEIYRNMALGLVLLDRKFKHHGVELGHQ